MCDPVTLTIAAGAVAAGGQIVSGVNTANQYRAQARLDNKNATLDTASAQDALSRGRIEEVRQGQATGRLVGQQRAALAANGVEVDYGSAGKVQQDTRQMGFEDAQTIRENAARESRGYEINAWNRRAKAAGEKAMASATMWKTAFDVVGTGLSTASQVSKMGP